MNDILILIESWMMGEWRVFQMNRIPKGKMSEKEARQTLNKMVQEYRKEGYVVRGSVSIIKHNA